MITITIPLVCVGSKCRRIPHSSNHKLHWAARMNWNEAWRAEVCYGFLAKRKALGKLPWSFAKIKIILKSCHEIDKDNGYTAAKPLIDALKVRGGCGIIIDDSRKYCDWEVVWQKANTKKDEGVEMTLA